MLREKVREELGGTYGVSLNGSASRRPREEYTITIGFGADPARVEELVEVIFAEIERLKTEGPSEENMQKVTEAQRRSRETNLKENGYWLGQIEAWDKLDGDYSRILDYEQFIDSVTPAMVQEMAGRVLDTENYVRVTLMPEEIPPAEAATDIPPAGTGAGDIPPADRYGGDIPPGRSSSPHRAPFPRQR